MQIKLRAIGTGTDKDPYRVNVPTWRCIDVDYKNGWMLVEIPDDVHGLTETDLGHETITTDVNGDHYAQLCAACTIAVHDHFDTKYQEHKGEFRLEFV